MRGAVPRLDCAARSSDLHREPVLHERHARATRWRRGCASRTAPRWSSSRRRSATAGSSRTRWARFATPCSACCSPPTRTGACGSCIPAASRAQDVPTFIHSKVMIVDDVLVRIGSANFSRRSMGVDTRMRRRRGSRAAIRACRRASGGFATGCSPSTSACRSTPSRAEIERAGSLRALIDARAQRDHTLVRIELPPRPETPPSRRCRPPPIPTSRSARRGRRPDSAGRRAVRARSASGSCRSSRVLAVGTPSPDDRPAMRRRSRRADAVVAWRAVLSRRRLVLVPLELLAIAAGVLFGAVRGGLRGAARIARRGRGRLRCRPRDGAGRTPRWMSRRAYGRPGSWAREAWSAWSCCALRRSQAPGRFICSAARPGCRSRPTGGTAIGLAPACSRSAAWARLLRRTLLDPSVTNALITIGARRPRGRWSLRWCERFC